MSSRAHRVTTSHAKRGSANSLNISLVWRAMAVFLLFHYVWLLLLAPRERTLLFDRELPHASHGTHPTEAATNPTIARRNPLRGAHTIVNEACPRFFEIHLQPEGFAGRIWPFVFGMAIALQFNLTFVFDMAHLDDSNRRFPSYKWHYQMLNVTGGEWTLERVRAVYGKRLPAQPTNLYPNMLTALESGQVTSDGDCYLHLFAKMSWCPGWCAAHDEVRVKYYQAVSPVLRDRFLDAQSRYVPATDWFRESEQTWRSLLIVWHIREGDIVFDRAEHFYGQLVYLLRQTIAQNFDADYAHISFRIYFMYNSGSGTTHVREDDSDERVDPRSVTDRREYGRACSLQKSDGPPEHAAFLPALCMRLGLVCSFHGGNVTTETVFHHMVHADVLVGSGSKMPWLAGFYSRWLGHAVINVRDPREDHMTGEKIEIGGVLNVEEDEAAKATDDDDGWPPKMDDYYHDPFDAINVDHNARIHPFDTEILAHALWNTYWHRLVTGTQVPQRCI